MTNHMTAALDAAKDGSKRAVAVFAVLAASMALVMAMAAPATAQTATVTAVDGNQWDPTSLEITAGTTVTFDMAGGDAGHNVAVDGTEVIPFTPIGQSATYTFENEGTFAVTCPIHPGMDMTVTVTAAENGDDNGDDNGDNGDNGEDPVDEEEPVDEEDPTDTEDPTDPADTADDTDDVEQPTAVESGSGGLVSTGFPMWVAALIGLGALALVAPAVATRRRS